MHEVGQRGPTRGGTTAVGGEIMPDDLFLHRGAFDADKCRTTTTLGIAQIRLETASAHVEKYSVPARAQAIGDAHSSLEGSIWRRDEDACRTGCRRRRKLRYDALQPIRQADGRHVEAPRSRRMG